MGTRLVGPALPHRTGARAITTPMIEGAIECPPDGPPIVLGPEHPTTGGYPLLAVVARRDLARFHRIPLGGSVRFAL
jgi:allophanate hydrolase subunit 2